MRILILGAGAIGGYLGARLQDAGGDVTFLVRPAAATRLREQGLAVRSPLGDTRIMPRVVVAGHIDGPYDLAVLSCKAPALDEALDAIAPAVGESTAVLPLLNGIAHLGVLDSRFGRQRSCGGLAHMAATLAEDGSILHLNGFSRFVVGSRGGARLAQLDELAALLAGAPTELTVSEDIEQDMWEKLVFLATLAAATCTMRASVGDILATAAGEQFILGLLDECVRTAAAEGHAPAPANLAGYRGLLTERGSGLTASMLRDIERGAATEGEHVVGEMVRRAERAGVDVPLLRTAHTHLQAYERRRQREAADR